MARGDRPAQTLFYDPAVRGLPKGSLAGTGSTPFDSKLGVRGPFRPLDRYLYRTSSEEQEYNKLKHKWESASQDGGIYMSPEENEKLSSIHRKRKPLNFMDEMGDYLQDLQGFDDRIRLQNERITRVWENDPRNPQLQQQQMEERRSQQLAQREADLNQRKAEAARQEQERLAAIRNQNIANLNKRIEFEKTNPLIERRRSASGRMFEAISPGQTYNVPEGSDILEGSFQRLPFISREEYNMQQDREGGRILGRGRVGSKKRGLLAEEEETLGKTTVLGV